MLKLMQNHNSKTIKTMKDKHHVVLFLFCIWLFITQSRHRHFLKSRIAHKSLMLANSNQIFWPAVCSGVWYVTGLGHPVTHIIHSTGVYRSTAAKKKCYKINNAIFFPLFFSLFLTLILPGNQADPWHQPGWVWWWRPVGDYRDHWWARDEPQLQWPRSEGKLPRKGAGSHQISGNKLWLISFTFQVSCAATNDLGQWNPNLLS